MEYSLSLTSEHRRLWLLLWVPRVESPSVHSSAIPSSSTPAQVPRSLCVPLKESGLLARDLSHGNLFYSLAFSPSRHLMSPHSFLPSSIYLNSINLHKNLRSDNHQGFSVPLKSWGRRTRPQSSCEYIVHVLDNILGVDSCCYLLNA